MIANYLKNSKILIVDDNEANVEVLESMLLMEGYENILATTDSRKVLEMYLKFEPDLILLDLMMPYMSGFEVMEQLNRLTNEQTYLPVLVLTADAAEATKKKALSTGASDFLSKPFDLIEVSLRIKNLLYTNYLYSQVKNQNLILEEKVKERTQELETKNEQLLVALEKADAANRLKQAFLNNISHEIRTPLNGIVGFRSLLKDESVSLEEKIDYIEIMQESSTRLINTITRFLDISLLHSGNMELHLSDLNPELIVYTAYEKYSTACAKKNIEFEMNTENLPENINVYSDEYKILKVFDNLVENAIKFTDGGNIVIGCEHFNNDIVFFVKDKGMGISPDFKDRIFFSFSQADEEINKEFEGLGLGLSISKGLVELMGGKIWYNSVPGQGTEFYFSIPLIKNETKIARVDLNGKTVHGNSTTKVLIVEDDETNYYILYFYFYNSNLELLWATDGIEAINIFKENPDISMVLMDLKLPHLDGFEATSEIKSINKQVPVIAVTSYAGIEQRQKAIHAGCDDIIVKPVNKQLLFEKLSKYLSFKTA
jgi:two-component system, sensor histidine kinase and response regulator